MKTLGIIGGLGPLATAYFYRRIVEMTPAQIDQEHIETLIYSCPSIPDRTSYLLGRSDDSPIPKMVDAGSRLKESGAEVLAIPCITAHAFHQELEKGIGIPVLHAIRELGDYCKKHGIERIGIMATDGARATRIYEGVLDEFGITCIWPSEDGQKQVMKMIYDDVKAGKKIGESAFATETEKLFADGSQAIVLGCTELSQAKNTMDLDDRYIDIIDVLAAACVRECAK